MCVYGTCAWMRACVEIASLERCLVSRIGTCGGIPPDIGWILPRRKSETADSIGSEPAAKPHELATEIQQAWPFLHSDSHVGHDDERHPNRRHNVVLVGLAHDPGQGELQAGKDRPVLHLPLVELEPLQQPVVSLVIFVGGGLLS